MEKKKEREKWKKRERDMEKDSLLEKERGE